jgi:hypothetical protein
MVGWSLASILTLLLAGNAIRRNGPAPYEEPLKPFCLNQADRRLIEEIHRVRGLGFMPAGDTTRLMDLLAFMEAEAYRHRNAPTPTTRTLRLKNEGSEPLWVPPFRTSVRWESADALLASLDLPSDPLARAVRIWSFLCGARTHWYSTLPTREIRDVPKHLAVYGGGLCSDAASVFAGLCGRMGLRSRVVHVNDHSVGEVLVRGRWRMFDPDCGVYYHRGDPKEICSAEDLARDPTLLANAVAAPHYAQWAHRMPSFHSFTPTHSRHFYQYDPGYVLDTILSQRLRPGEEWILGDGQTGHFLFAGRHDPPRFYRNGWLHTPLPTAGGRVESCFPIVAATLKAEVRTGAPLRLRATAGPRSTSFLMEENRAYSVVLDRLFATMDDEPVYSLDIVLEPSRREPANVSLECVSVVQYSTLVAPVQDRPVTFTGALPKGLRVRGEGVRVEVKSSVCK